MRARPILWAVTGLWVLAGCGGDDASNASDDRPNAFDNNGGASGSGDESDSDADGFEPGQGPFGDPNQPAAPGIQPTFTPDFPGAGTDADDGPLTNGKLCDYVPENGAPTPNEIVTCFFGTEQTFPEATLEQVLECAEGTDTVHIRLTFNPDFVDNTYGANAIGWNADDEQDDQADDGMAMGAMAMGGKAKKGKAKNGHTFKDLVGSDHAEILMKDEDGNVIMHFKLDYLTEDPDAPSGYSSLGVLGGEGKVIVGDPAWVIDATSSLDRNLNERGYGSYVVDSPATDADYSPNQDAPGWDYRVVYEAWIDVTAFGEAGFDKATIEFVHASPSKKASNTVEVKEEDCPPELCNDPKSCREGCGDNPDEDCGEDDPPPPGDECGDDPDDDCGTGEPPNKDEPIDCEEDPEDPACHVE